MKKLLITLILLAGIVAISQVQQRQYSVSGTPQDWQAILEVIENSNSPHQQVKGVQGFIMGQLEKQDKSYRMQDSIAKVK